MPSIFNNISIIYKNVDILLLCVFLWKYCKFFCNYILCYLSKPLFQAMSFIPGFISSRPGCLLWPDETPGYYKDTKGVKSSTRLHDAELRKCIALHSTFTTILANSRDRARHFRFFRPPGPAPEPRFLRPLLRKGSLP